MPISEQRCYLNTVLLPKLVLMNFRYVLDIGKSTTWDYSKFFGAETIYKTIDINSELKPDICEDFSLSKLDPKPDCILFNGVFEQCNNPFSMLESIKRNLASKGTILFGLASVGMAPYGFRDKWRVTYDGMLSYTKDFEVVDIIKFPAYYYVLARNRD